MIDNLHYQLEQLSFAGPSPLVSSLKHWLSGEYLCLTMHSPSNVDSQEQLTNLMTAIHELAREQPVIFACHPRTRQRIAAELAKTRR